MSQLAEIIRRLSQPLTPEPTEIEPRLPRLDGIRVIVFDVYGTLLISGSGDISLTSGASRGDAAIATWQSVLGEPPASASGDNLVDRLHTVIRANHAASPHEFPEVEIRRIWQEVASELGAVLDESQAARLSVEYECRVNPVWPMPGMAPTLAAIREAGLALGIVSNAQFFTPLAMEQLSGETMRSLGFDPTLCIWSYEQEQAKPGRFLYDQSAEALAERGFAPREVLYIGNDLLNDVWPASTVGFRTALFAGDARSLRLREDDPRVAGVEPDAVITELREVLEVLSLAGG
ncbi:MAG: HAD family hydrolase [Planctomycetota bacterium]